jgi:hypothetical protein
LAAPSPAVAYRDLSVPFAVQPGLKRYALHKKYQGKIKVNLDIELGKNILLLPQVVR